MKDVCNYVRKNTIRERAYNQSLLGGQGARTKDINNVFIKQNVVNQNW